MVPDRNGAVLLQTNSDAGSARCGALVRSVQREWFAWRWSRRSCRPRSRLEVDLDRWVGAYERVDVRFGPPQRAALVSLDRSTSSDPPRTSYAA